MLRRIGAEEGGEFKAIASGTLPSGRPVIVNADGTVSVVAETTVTESAGTPVEWSAEVIRYTSAAYDANAQKVVVAYYNFGDSGHGYAAVGTVSGTTISFGTPVEFENAEIRYTAISYDTSSQKVLITYQDIGNSNYGTAIVGTVSGTSISFGTATVFKSAATSWQESVYDPDSQKVIIAFSVSSSQPQAAVATISGTSVSFGSLTSFGGTSDSVLAMAYDTNADRVVIAYRDGSNTYSNAVVGTVSGTSISFGTEVAFSGAGTEEGIGIAYDSDNQKIVIGFTASDVAKGIVGTVSGTSISFGTAVNFNSGNTAFKIRAVYDSNAQKVVFFFRGAASTYYGQAVSGTVSGTSISFGSVTTFQSSRTEEIAAVYDANAQKSVVVYRDYAQSRGDAVVFTTGSVSQNLTSENYIGMSRGTAFQTGSDTSVGSETQFITNMGNEISEGVFDPDSNKVILAYSDQDNSVRGTAIVGTVSGTSISFGTPAVYNTSETTHIGITYDTTNDKVVIVYRDGTSNNNYGNAIVGTVSGTDISFGTAAVYNTATSHNNSAVFDSNTGKVVIAFRDNSNNNVTSRVATVSGTSISFGTAVQVDANGNEVAAVFDSNSNKVVVVYKDVANSNYGTARVGTVSGTDISFGTEAVFNSGSTGDIHCTFDSSNNKVVIAYKDGGDSDKGNVVVGTISGTDISFGSEVTFHDASTNGMDNVVYNSNLQKLFFFYRDSSAVGKFVSGTISGTAVSSISSETTYHNASTSVPFQIYDGSSTNIVAAYRDSGDSNKGKAVVVKPDDRATTRAELADGSSASVDIIGSVSDNQIGLTAGQQYFVQNDGTISETADSPSVLAGTAISATKLLVKT
tara:strand:+ start:5 stop:2569 length:2565 start_codon:yes stop_codon:yes gene_type:complete